jgi:hypothetical protein
LSVDDVVNGLDGEDQIEEKSANPLIDQKYLVRLRILSIIHSHLLFDNRHETPEHHIAGS